MNKTTKSIEETIEFNAKGQLASLKCYDKNDFINSEIEHALKTYPSKSGNDGGNYPDIKLLIRTKSLRTIPVVIEVKGKKEDLHKFNTDGDVDNTYKNGTPNYKNIKKYALNGAVHYANAIIQKTQSYKEVIAIGISGYYQNNELVTNLDVYYISADNLLIPKRIGNYEDLTFLLNDYIDVLIERIDTLSLTEEEIEEKAKNFENQIEVVLKELNKQMRILDISANDRVPLLVGMIIAGLGVEDKVTPLEISDLKGENSEYSNDGKTIYNKILAFLGEKELPNEKKKLILTEFEKVLILSNLYTPTNNESKLKQIYKTVKLQIIPIFTSARHLDFTGKLFNTILEWEGLKGDEKKDVVLTPRYVTEFMAKLAKVNKDSYVWDFATGSAGFLISAMKLMIKDAEQQLSGEKLKSKIKSIKTEQLLGIEKRTDIYLLAVLNMILMGDGSTNIIHDDSLTNYNGKYEQGANKDKKFPANVFLLNPPYSADGKGFVFVEKALKYMTSGRAVVIIQDSAGTGKGLPYTRNILKNNTLIASIHMDKIFSSGGITANVQPEIYVFDIGVKHDKKQKVKFIDFSYDGYKRQSRNNASQETNLRNVDHAIERYEEVKDLVLYGKSYLNYYTENEYIEDTIDEYIEDVDNNCGKDWNFLQHKKIDTIPKQKDFEQVINNYLTWQISDALQGEKHA